MKTPPPSAIEQTRIQALKEFRGLLHEALTSAVADEGVPDAFKDAINWDKLIDQTEQRLVEVWRQRFDSSGKPLQKPAMGSLRLLQEEEHESQVLSEMFVNEVSRKDQERLDQLEQLLASISGHHWDTPQENPLGPSMWVEGVRGGMQQFKATPEERSWLLQRLVPLLMARMGNFYGSINNRLSTISGVPLRALSGRRPTTPAPAVSQEPFAHDLVENTSANRAAEAAPDDEDEGNSDVLERLFSLLGARRTGGYPGGGMAAPGMIASAAAWPAQGGVPGMVGAPGYGYPQGQYPGMPGGYPAGQGYDAGGMPMAPAPMWSETDLLSVLGMMQSNYIAAPGMVPGAAGGSAARLFEAVTQAASQMGMAGGAQAMPGPAQDMMELVNMLFEALLDGRRLDERARSQLARLVIPYVRVALLDRRMFMKSRHPARRFLNLLVESLETASVDAPQYKDLREMAFAAIDRIVGEFKDDMSIFEELDKSLSEALQERRRGAEIAERRMADAERGRERRSAAMATVHEQMQRSTGGTVLPDAVQRFLSGPWQHHQTILVLREGPGGEQALANQALVYSLAKASRQGGQVDLAPLRPGIESVLASSGQTAEEVDAMLAELSIAISSQPEAMPTAAKPATRATPALQEPTNDADVEAKLLAEIASFVAEDESIPAASFASVEIEGADSAEPEATPSGLPAAEAAAIDPVASAPIDDRTVESDTGSIETAADDPADAQAFIDSFVNEAPVAAEAEAVVAPVPAAVPEPPPVEVEVAAPPEADEDMIERYRRLKVGDWLDLVNDDGRITAARISWTSPISGRHMLSNRRGQRLMVASVEELALMEVEGQVSIRPNDAAFDVALRTMADRLARTTSVAS